MLLPIEFLANRPTASGVLSGCIQDYCEGIYFKKHTIQKIHNQPIDYTLTSPLREMYCRIECLP